jgi:Phosphatidylinositol-glycan biosynthesis class S protein
LELLECDVPVEGNSVWRLTRGACEYRSKPHVQTPPGSADNSAVRTTDLSSSTATMSNLVDHGLKDPSTLPFEQPRTRVTILASYLLLIVLGLPLWWSTTSIERLSLPTSHVDSLGSKEVSRWLNG